MVSTILKWLFQCERQKCRNEKLQALLDDDSTQTMLSSTMFNLNNALIEKRHGKMILLHDKTHQNWQSKQFFWRGIHNLPERWSKCVEAVGQSFE
jgi:hypothetical protein